MPCQCVTIYLVYFDFFCYFFTYDMASATL